MAKILLTGAAGFIGMHVLERMSVEHEVIGIDNLSDFSNYDIKLKRLVHMSGSDVVFGNSGVLDSNRISFRKLDILDEENLQALFAHEKFDMVIHLAAMTGIRQSIDQPDIYEKVNERGFFNVIECARKFGVKKFLFASSSSVYGQSPDVPFTEMSNTDTPLNLYAATKKMNELIAHSYATLYQMKCIGLRFFTVYGPWNRPDMATFTFMKNIDNGLPIKLYNAGNMKRDFTYVDDIVESIYRLSGKMLQADPSERPYRIFNIGGSNPVNLRDYVAAIEELLAKKAIIENHDLQVGEMISTYADCSALSAYIGFKPQVGFREGLSRTVDWYTSHRDIS